MEEYRAKLAAEEAGGDTVGFGKPGRYFTAVNQSPDAIARQLWHALRQAPANMMAAHRIWAFAFNASMVSLWRECFFSLPSSWHDCVSDPPVNHLAHCITDGFGGEDSN